MEIICEGNINKFFVKTVVSIRWLVAGFKGAGGCAAGAGMLLLPETFVFILGLLAVPAEQCMHSNPQQVDSAYDNIFENLNL